jgi:Tol biopolymer transport system component/DNA-binding winged helix-turn-helix (wHTH) protein
MANNLAATGWELSEPGFASQADKVSMPALDGTSSQVVRFGLYEVDLAARELRREGKTVKLQDRPFEVLLILLERPGQIITREEFRQRLWSADTFVDFDASLNTSINKLRQALSDNAENPRFIATAGRRGYRFVAPASVVKAEGPALESPIASIEIGTPATVGNRRLWWKYSAAVLCALLLLGIALLAALLPEPLPKVSSVTQISHDGLLDPWGRIASDGARLFFLDRIGGHWTLMQVPASGGEAQPFPEQSRNLRIADVSPDRGELLTFSFGGRSGDLPLSITSVVGGQPRRVGNIVADDAVFSPDGRRILFSRPDGIYSCLRDGSQVQQLVALQGRSEDPRWSNDGRRLRFTLHDRTGDGSSIWEVSADGSNLHAVDLHLPVPGSTYSGRWSADGRYFFFDSMHDGIQSIWALRESPRGWRLRAARPVQLTFGPNNYGGLIAGSNKDRVFVWSGNEHLEVARYYADSGRIEPLLAGTRSPSVTLAPAGDRLSFATGGELWRSRVDGSQRELLVSGSPPIDDIRWSPDGRRILFHAAESGTRGRFFIVAADGGVPAEVPLGNGQEPAWSPDGEGIVFAKWATEHDASLSQSGIYLLDLRSSRITKVPGSEGLVHPSLSPDRRYFAAITNFDLNPTEPTRVKLFDVQTQTWAEIDHGTLVNPVEWSSDSKSIYYQDILGEGQPAFRYSTIAKKAERFMDFTPLINAGYVRCSWKGFAPDGALIVSLRRNEVNIYRLDLDLP